MDRNVISVTTYTAKWDTKLIWKIVDFEKTLSRDKSLISPNLRVENLDLNLKMDWSISLKLEHSNILIWLNPPRTYGEGPNMDYSYEIVFGNPGGASIVHSSHGMYNSSTLESFENRLTVPLDQITGQRESICPAGTLRIVVDLHIFLPHTIQTDASALQNIPDPKDTMEKWIASLFNNSLYSDVTIKCQDRAYHCHRQVLGRSSVFAAMFSTDMKESISKEVVISDVDPPILETFLKYLYYQPLNLQMGYKEFLELIDYAERYDLAGLMFTCLRQLASMITDENAGEINVAVHKYCRYEEYTQIFKDYCLKREAVLMKDPAYRKIYAENYQAFQ